MNKQLLIVGAIASLFASTKIIAQEQEKTENLDEVVVTATKFELKKEHTGKVIYKITKKDIENNAGRTVVELLNNLPGIEINGANTNRGSVRNVYIRGGRSRQVLILIDGVPVSDASGINQVYDLRLLSLNQIEKIEVLKGAASSLYGTGAATGVINIILKKSSKNDISATYEASFGTNNSSNSKSLRANDRNQNVSINGTLGDVSYLAYFNLTGTQGMSSARSNTAAKFEDDAYYGRNGLFKLGYQITKAVKIDAFLNYDAFDSEFDAGAYSDNSINKWEYSQVRYGVKPSFKYNGGELYALASFNEITRDLLQFNSFSNTNDTSIYEGTGLNIDLVNKYSFLDNKLQVIAGVNYQENKNYTKTPFSTITKNVANFNTVDPYASVVYISDYGFNVNVGGRLNMHSVYDNHFVYDGNVSYNLFKDRAYKIKALASYGTAFIAPSLYQLYSSSGNLDLKPEDSKTIEVGFEAAYKGIVKFSAVYFDRTENDAIEFDYTTFKYYNTDKKGNGIETALEVKPIKNLKLTANYTYTDMVATEHFDDYIPNHKIVAAIETNLIKNTFMSLVYKNVGDRIRFDRYGSFGAAGENVILPSYNLVDFNINHKLLNNKVTFFGSVSNLLNEDYEEILGYNTRGRNYKLGVRLQF
ncbi:TonB-dependent receptor [Tenacibaculum sp. HL-MS23]|uniref:TonB-dependent receptor plug domain-containing protein n=1 Tax=Tenacibaculum sp. HL-MS23 TaxID=3077734 RepID=UPI0028FC1291|nr:TonB-dependent receptor [Tenacibaculum sp. HL-MS23]WNW02286.1 TonB-dependent receptor [Tenacibaculum sp. HL-MS23]